MHSSDTVKSRPGLARADMEAPKPWYIRGRDLALRFWRTRNPKLAAVRDVLAAGLVVFVLLGVIWAYTGQPFPAQAPLVVVESGSMMHGPASPCAVTEGCDGRFERPGFGRIGTIDPGDLVLVKEVDSFADIETAFGTNGRSGYGGHGDVVVYQRGGQSGTPVIHRVMLLIEAEEGCLPNNATNPCVFRIPETCNADVFAEFVYDPNGSSNWRDYCAGSSQPISMTLRRDGLFLNLISYPCTTECPAFYSGYITKGDNNPAQDQLNTYMGRNAGAGAIACCPVPLDWIIGKARGEIPWFGLIKLALYGNERYQCGQGQSCSDPTRDSQWTLLRATAPWDIWVSLFIAVGALVLLPIGADYVVGRIRKHRMERRPPPEAPSPPEEPPPPPPEGPAEP